MHLLSQTKHYQHISSGVSVIPISYDEYTLICFLFLQWHCLDYIFIVEWWMLYWLSVRWVYNSPAASARSSLWPSIEDRAVASAQSHWTKKQGDWVMLWQYQCCTLMADGRLHPGLLLMSHASVHGLLSSWVSESYGLRAVSTLTQIIKKIKTLS